MRLILPCSGYGTRVNCRPDESKELFINPTTGQELIQFSLDVAEIFNMEPLVVTRKEKKDLIEWCENRGIETQIIEVEGEWADTVLKSSINWHDYNLLMLPDTRFNFKMNVVQSITLGLSLGNNAVFGVHEITDPIKWGVIQNNVITEKPSVSSAIMAWGVIGFQQHYGQELFKAMRYKDNPFTLENCGYTLVNGFEDLTRNGWKR